jgi:hypothetical protein
MVSNIFPLSRLVAGYTESNEIVHVICELVIGKFGKRDFMVDL